MTIWEEVINFINNRKDENDLFRPVVVKKSIYCESSVVTSYINYLHKAKFIQRVNNGVYRRIRMIPETLTVKKIREFIYNDAGADNPRKSYDARDNAVKRYWFIKDIKDKINDQLYKL